MDSPRARIEDIELLRACAVLMTVAAHVIDLIPLPLWTSYARMVHGVGFWQGVDLFFVISGFVIGRSLLPQLDFVDPRGRWAIVLRFLVRRFWRLWPASWLWLGLVLVACQVPLGADAFGPRHANLWSALAGIGLFANLRFAYCVNGHWFYGAMTQYWSLSLEEQFYLILPGVVLLCGKRLPWVLATGIALQLPLPRGPYLTVLRTDALLWGVLLATLERSAIFRRIEPTLLQRTPLLARILVIGLLCLLPLIGSNSMRHPPFEIGIIACVATVLVWLASYDAQIIAQSLIFRRTLTSLGRRSYTLYLVHVPCFLLAATTVRLIAAHVTMSYAWQAVSSMAIAAILLPVFTELTYRYVEVPCRRYGRRIHILVASRSDNRAP